MSVNAVAFKVEEARCVHCGQCAAECPVKIIRMKDRFPRISTKGEKFCIGCQHCFAICPTSAISIFNKAAGIGSACSLPVSAESMESFLKARRSVRRYRWENLDEVTFGQLLDVASYAPSGENHRSVHFSVVRNKDVMAELRDRVMNRLCTHIQSVGLAPEHNVLKAIVRRWQQREEDLLFRGAPHLIVASAPKDCATPTEDCLLALCYFDLMAAALGVGTLWNGMLKWALDDVLSMAHTDLEIPEGHEIGYVLSFGPSAVEFHRPVQLDQLSVHELT